MGLGSKTGRHFFLILNCLASATVISPAATLFVLKDGSVTRQTGFFEGSDCQEKGQADTCAGRARLISNPGESKSGFFLRAGQLFFLEGNHDAALDLFNLARKSGASRDTCLYYMSECAFKTGRPTLALNMNYAQDTAGSFLKDAVLFQRLRFFKQLELKAEAAHLDSLLFPEKYQNALMASRIGHRKISLRIQSDLYFSRMDYEDPMKDFSEFLTSLLYLKESLPVNYAERAIFSDDDLLNDGLGHSLSLQGGWELPGGAGEIKPVLNLDYTLDKKLLSDPTANFTIGYGLEYIRVLFDGSTLDIEGAGRYKRENWYNSWYKNEFGLDLNFFLARGFYSVYFMNMLEYNTGNIKIWNGPRIYALLSNSFRTAPFLEIGVDLGLYYYGAPSNTVSEPAHVAYCDGLKDKGAVNAAEVQCYEDSTYSQTIVKDPFRMGSDTDLIYHYQGDFNLTTKKSYGYLSPGAEFWVRVKPVDGLVLTWKVFFNRAFFSSVYRWHNAYSGDRDVNTIYIKKNKSDGRYYYTIGRSLPSLGRNFVLENSSHERRDYMAGSSLLLRARMGGRTWINGSFRFKYQNSNLKTNPQVFANYISYDARLGVAYHWF